MLLNTLEAAAGVAKTRVDGDAVAVIDETVLDEVVRQTPQALFGRETHYDCMSALHKSIRASDPDASVRSFFFL